MENIKVSIVTVCRNAEKTIEQTIKSVIGQTYSLMEYIIVDGASEDGTLRVINQYRDLIDMVISEPDGGIYDAMNKGIKKATGDLIGILNADDWYEPDAVECIVREFQRWNHVGVISGQIRFIKQNQVVGKSKYRDVNEIWKRMPIAHPAAFVTRETYHAVGLFDASFKIAADYDLIFRCFLEGIKFKYLDDVLTNFRIGGISGTRYLELYQEDERIFNKYGRFCADRSLVEDALVQKRRLLSFWTATSAEIRQFFDFGPNTYIFGGGYWGSMLAAKFIEADMEFDGFLDNACAKQETRIFDHTVFAPAILEKCPKGSKVIVAVEDAFVEIKAQIFKINPFVKAINYMDIIDRLYIQKRRDHPVAEGKN